MGSISQQQYEAMLLRTTPQRQPPKASAADPPEAKLHEQILEHCRGKGWFAIHSRMDRKATNQVGLADFVILADGGRMFAVECKRPGAKPRPEQLAFAAHCKKLGHRHAFCWSYAEFCAFVTEIL